jgi:hypothetical protein
MSTQKTRFIMIAQTAPAKAGMVRLRVRRFNAAAVDASGIPVGLGRANKEFGQEGGFLTDPADVESHIAGIRDAVNGGGPIYLLTGGGTEAEVAALRAALAPHPQPAGECGACEQEPCSCAGTGPDAGQPDAADAAEAAGKAGDPGEPPAEPAPAPTKADRRTKQAGAPEAQRRAAAEAKARADAEAKAAEYAALAAVTATQPTAAPDGDKPAGDQVAPAPTLVPVGSIEPGRYVRSSKGTVVRVVGESPVRKGYVALAHTNGYGIEQVSDAGVKADTLVAPLTDAECTYEAAKVAAKVAADEKKASSGKGTGSKKGESFGRVVAFLTDLLAGKLAGSVQIINADGKLTAFLPLATVAQDERLTVSVRRAGSDWHTERFVTAKAAMQIGVAARMNRLGLILSPLTPERSAEIAALSAGTLPVVSRKGKTAPEPIPAPVATPEKAPAAPHKGGKGKKAAGKKAAK